MCFFLFPCHPAGSSSRFCLSEKHKINFGMALLLGLQCIVAIRFIGKDLHILQNSIKYCLLIPSYLAMELIIRATPLMEPNLSRVTELLINMKLADSPIVRNPLMGTVNMSNMAQRAGLLQGN